MVKALIITAIIVTPLLAGRADGPCQPPDLSGMDRDALEILAKNLYRRVHDLEQADAGRLLDELERTKDKVRSLETTMSDLRGKLHRANREIVRLGGRGPSAVESTEVVDVESGGAETTDKEGDKRIVVFKSVEEILKLIPADLRPKATGKREFDNTVELGQWAGENLAGKHFEGKVIVDHAGVIWNATHLVCLQKKTVWRHFKTSFSIQTNFPKEQSDKLAALETGQQIALRGEITSVGFSVYRNWLTVTVILQDAEIKP